MFRIWYQYNIEPIPGWKMFRTASMLWQTYRLKHREGKTIRSAQEESGSFNFPIPNISNFPRSGAATLLDMLKI
jgi:hypothetical protein